MFSATCATCNKQCEVPFRPNGSKPVYCKDCFGKKKGAYPSNNMPKNDFTERTQSARQDRPENHVPAQAPRSENRDARIDELKAQVFSMQAKLDRILKAMESGKSEAPVAPAVPMKKEIKKEVKKALVAKKPAAKAKPVAKKKK
jgi:CxxC-x17-CxxC domain-containing protein